MPKRSSDSLPKPTDADLYRAMRWAYANDVGDHDPQEYKHFERTAHRAWKRYLKYLKGAH